MATCVEFRGWLKEEGLRGPWPPWVGEHVNGCAGCRSLLRAYQTVVDVARVATDSRTFEPDMRAIRRGLAGGGLRWHLRWAVPAVAAAAMAAGIWMLAAPVPRETEGTKTSLEAAAAAPAVPAQATRVAHAGQRIETGESAVTVSDDAVGSVRIEPETLVHVVAWAPGNTLLVLVSGRVTAAVRHVEGVNHFEVRTPFATVRAIGTRFTVAHRTGLDTEVEVSEGSVGVETLTGVRVARLSAGQSVHVTPTAVVGPEPAGDAVADAGRAGLPVLPPPSGLPRVAAVSRPQERARVPVLAQAHPDVPATAEVTAPAASSMTVDEVVTRGRKMIAEGRHAEAVEWLAAMAGGDLGRNPRVVALLGDAYRVSGNSERARAAYEQALKLPGVGEGVLVDLAMLLDADLGLADEAAATWRRYLEAYPRGQSAGRAFWALAMRAEAGGRKAEAEDWLRRLASEAPSSPEAARAVARVGRKLLREGRLEEALRWFEQYRNGTTADVAEAALVGVMRVRAQQGRASDVRALADEHGRRFPDGKRQNEVKSLLSGEVPGSE